MSIEHPLTTPLIQENPLALRVLGLCPALAITNSLTSALIMSAALTVVLVISNTIISLVRKLLPSSVRLIVQITIIASAVTVIDQFLKAFLPVGGGFNRKPAPGQSIVEYLEDGLLIINDQNGFHWVSHAWIKGVGTTWGLITDSPSAVNYILWITDYPLPHIPFE